MFDLPRKDQSQCCCCSVSVHQALELVIQVAEMFSFHSDLIHNDLLIDTDIHKRLPSRILIFSRKIFDL